MKKQIFTFFFSLTLSISFSQNNNCGFELNDENRVQYESFLNIEQNRSQQKFYIPVVYHLIGRSNGTGLYKMKDLFVSHCEMNEAFDSLGFEFYIHSLDTILNTTYYEFSSFNTGTTIKNQNNVPNVCNIYLNNDPAGVCGYATFPGSPAQGIFVKHSCFGPGSSTLIHEMGHYMGLVHTFETSYGIEFVNGTNCSTKGDRFCDTPADFISDRWNCPYTGNDLDPNGDSYLGVIDGTFFMSYSDDDCQSRFSNQQKNHMRNVLPTQRSGHLYQDMPSNSPLAVPTPLFPLNNDTTVSPSAATFIWNSVPGASYYHFIMPGSTPLIQYADIITTDTFVTVSNLIANRNYKWQVKSFAFGNVCGSYSQQFNIKTSGFKVELSVTNPSCTNNSGSINTQLLNAISPINFSWSNGDSTSSLSGLSPGIYSVTAIDSTGEIATASVVISPTNLPDIQLLLSNNNTVIEPVITNAGASNLNYFWSTGATSQNLNNVIPGTYFLTVATSTGCLATASIIVPGYGEYNPPLVNIIESNNSSFTLWPNPSNHSFNIKSDSNFDNPKLNLINVLGESIEAIFSFQDKNHILVKTEHLPSGFYFVKIEKDKNSSLLKILIEN